MEIRNRVLGAMLALSALLIATTPVMAADRAYTEGPVIDVTSVRTEPGKFDEYLRYLSGPYKQSMEEQKKAGIILDYAIYQATPRGPHDPDLYLVITYKNMAALDGLNERTDAIVEKVFGSSQQQDAATIARGKMRTILGNEYMRQLNLK